MQRRDSNSRFLDYNSDVVTTTLPSHHSQNESPKTLDFAGSVPNFEKGSPWARALNEIFAFKASYLRGSARSGHGCCWSLIGRRIRTFDGTPRNSAKLTNQRVSCAFTSSPFSFHVRYILPTSKFEHSYSGTLRKFYADIRGGSLERGTVNWRTVSVNTAHWFDASFSGNPSE